MKRSSCLSVVLVGLALATAPAALAAPEARKVSQAQDATASSASSSTTSPTVPVITVGAGTPAPAPGSDAPPAAASAPSTTPKPRPWAGSAMMIMQSMTTNTVFRGQTQYSDPTAEGSVWLLPRYALTKDYQLRGRLIVSYEQTNSDETTKRGEALLSDTTLQLFRRLPKLPGKINPGLMLNVGLPTSKLSIARTLVFTPGATLQLVRGFENVLGGDLTAIGGLTYSHPIYRSKNPVLVDPRPYPIQCAGGTNCTDLASGTMNPSDILSYSLILVGEWGKWSPALFYLGARQWTYRPTEASINLNNDPNANISIPRSSDAVTVRQTHYLSAWLDYNFNSWLTGEVGYWNSTNAIDGTGQRANVIFNRLSGDTRVYLAASIQLDNFVKAIQGAGDGDAGIVRAKNTAKPPLFSF